MAFFPNDSAIKVPAGSELEKAISQAGSVSEISALLFQAAVSQSLIAPDPLDRDGRDYFNYKPVETGSAAAAKGVAKVLVVDGKKYVIEGKDDAEMASRELELMRSLFNTSVGEEQPRNERGQFVAQSQEQIDASAERLVNADPAEQVQAELVRKALEAQGIDVEALKEFTAAKQGEKYQMGWKQATEEFLQGAGADWPGGENMAVAARIIQENNMIDKPSVDTLARVWQYMKENGLVVENPELTARDAASKAQTYEELKAAIGYRGADVDYRGSGGLFGGH